MLKLQLYHDMYYVQTSPLSELNRRIRAGADAELYHLRGIAYFQDFEFRLASEDFDRAIELEPDLVTAIFHRGAVRVVRGDYDQAMEDFNRVIELDPKHAAAYYNRGRLQFWKAEYDAAIADFEKTRRLDPLLGRELKLRYVIGRIERGPDDDSVVSQVQGILDRLRDL
jgi:tetratricopeptide (TPR) repeat protein